MKPNHVPAGTLLHTLFTAQAARVPHAVAVVAADEQLTYAELEARSRRLAHSLRALGVRPDDRVGICVERGIGMVVGLMGILRAGGAYVPMDPTFPAQRLAAIGQDAALRALVTQSPLRDRLPADLAPRLCIDEPDVGLDAGPLLEAATVDNLAYVLFTSGSTGRPKGVEIPHGALVRFIEAIAATFDFGPSDVLLAVSSLTFDASVMDLFLPLCTGARVVVASRADASDGARLGALLDACEATFVQATPATYRLLIESGWAGRPTLRVSCVGEALSRDLADGLLQRCAALWNGYGPTETTVYATTHRVTADGSAIPIGRPIANTRTYVVDEHLQPAREGELCIGGASVGRGYLGQPELTASRFVADPFTGDPEARMYRSGDLVRLRDDGCLEWLGRIDQQIKIRGFRIEPGDIESQLLRLPQVRQAVVVANEDPSAGKRLVAYVIVEGGAASPTELRAHLAACLPDYMVPAAFVQLTAFPLTTSGKIDRKALPAPDADAFAVDAAYAPPRTPTERSLAALWARVLGVPRVGIHDDFYALGGHSLAATRIAASLPAGCGMHTVLEHPTIAALAAAVDGAGGDREPLPRVSRSGHLPLSWPQEQLWLLEQIAPGTPLYNEAHGLRLRGGLDAAALRRALDALAARHEILRTTYVESRQIVHPPLPVPLAEDDLRALPEADRGDAAQRLAAAEAARPFDLGVAPLLRAHLVRHSDDEWLLLVVMHHIACDGWSIDVMWRDLDALYAGRELAELPLQYADWAAWQRAACPGDETLAWWKERLAGAPARLDLPTDRRRPEVASTLGAVRRRRLPADLAARIDTLARRHGATRFMILLAAWQALLHRWSGEADVVVGIPSAGRDRVETEALMGYFVNMLVIRTDCGGDPRFGDLLGRVREGALQAMAHASLPFPRLVEALQPRRSPAWHPLFQVGFGVQDRPPATHLGPLAARPFDAHSGTAKFDLDLTVADGPDGLECAVEYRTDLFEAASMERLLDRYALLVESAVAAPQERIGALAWMTPTERHEVVVAFNPPPAAPPADRCLHELFHIAAARAPHAVAVEAEGERVTYAELRGRAARVAHHLCARGVGVEDRVGLLLPRSVAQIAAMLGIMQAGAACVPLDAAWPEERRAWVIQDAGIRVVVNGAAMEGDALLPAVTPANAAYVIYTSGSTGVPKGVVVEHRTAARYVLEAGALFDLAADDRVLQFASATFDASVEEIFCTLARGATLVLRTDEMLASSAEFLAQCARRRVSVLDLPTAFWHELVAAIDTRHLELPPAIRMVILGGERAMPDRVAAFRRAIDPAVRLLNGYGPTEATIAATFWEAPHGFRGDTEVPIGRPLPHVEAFVLDAALAPVPVGVPGELCLGGACLARGYLNRPDVTAQRFVPHPFRPGDRVYRTGDRARWRPDGQLDYLGRLDRQVKIRGFRIEPGEVEAALEAHPAVREAVVATPADAAGHPRLVAYVVAAADAGDLRPFLKRTLPDYMVPSVFVRLASMPRNTSGKVDRAALPAPPQRPDVIASYTAPRTPLEQAVAGIWADVLGVNAVGIHDDFFELGGHSLLAARAVARLRETCGVPLPLRALFDAPTVAGVAAAVSGLAGSGTPAIEPVPRDGALPLTYGQEGLWLVDQMSAAGPLYNVPLALRLRGALDAEALRRALDALVARHEILRTRYVAEDGRPRPRIDPPAPADFAADDLTDLPPAQRESAATRRAEEAARRPFDLSRDAVLRSRLLRLAADDHLWVLVVHHIACDAVSIQVLLHELGVLYEGAPLPAPRLQHADYAAWQRAALDEAALAPPVAWWVDRLSGAPAVLDLPTDRARPAVPTHRGGVARHAMPGGLAEGLRALSRRHGASLFMTLLAGWKAVLQRWSGQDDLVVGTPLADRPPEAERMVGYLINSLALRTDCGGDPTFAELLRRVRETALGAFAHASVPFDRVVEALGPQRDPRYHPLFQVAFSLLEDDDANLLQLPDVEVTAVALDTLTAKFDLDLAVVQAGEGLLCTLEYDADLFTEATAARLLDHFAHLLAAAVADPQEHVARLSLMGDEERRLVVETFNRTAAEYPRDRTVDQLFAEQANASPDAVAVEFMGSTLTYAELDRQSRRVAGALQRRGVGPDVPVGLCMERSLEMIVATLAILQAGGAYVPLDPEYPPSRLAGMLADAAAPLVVAQRKLADRLPAGTAMLFPDGCDDAASELRPAATPDSIGYLMYTSGSTGRPKGVAVPHRAIVRLVRGADYVRFAADDAFLQLAPISFDAATFEIWGALLNGARLVVMPPGPPSLADIGDAIRQRGITTLWLTAGLFHLMVDERPDDLAGLRNLLAGGDTLSPGHVRRARQALGSGRLINGYGPTENTTFTTCHTVTAADENRPSVPIGRPIANTRVYVLDRLLQPVPIGVPGELYAAGDGLARGYWNRPDLTAERFMAAPTDVPEARLYRTGDRARWLADGTLEFRGRLDHQVKIRGFRIEPAEIEAVLETHPEVRGCAVAARPDAAGQKRLVAWVLAPAAAAASLRHWLEARLPDFMVPSAFVAIDALPLSPNGKLDRAALPDPEFDAACTAAPGTPAEQLVADIWADVLGLERVWRQDHFFERGGTSLSGARVMARLQKAFGVALSLRTLFEAPTVAALAAAVEAARGSDTVATPHWTPALRDGALPLSFNQERLWLVDQIAACGPLYNVPLALRLRGVLDVGALRGALDALVARHEILRTTYALDSGLPRPVIAPPAPLEVIDEDVPEADLPQRATEIAALPFDLTRGVLRCHLLRVSSHDHTLVLVIHHIACDGRSLEIILDDLSALYEGRDLSPLPLQYVDYAAWQRAARSDEGLAPHLAWWRERLAGMAPVLEIPTDHPRPPSPTYRGGTVARRLPAGLAAAVRRLARQHGATPFMALLAAFQAILQRWSGQDDLAIGTPVAERSDVETEGLVGFFVNTLVLRMDGSGEPTFTDLVQRAREVTLAAHARRAVPFERLVEALQPQRDPRYHPLFQVAFSMLECDLERSLRLPAVEVTPLALDTHTAKFDLGLEVTWTPDGLHCTLEYGADLFTEATATRLLEHYAHLLAAAVADPQQPVSRLPLMGEDERRLVVETFNQTATAYPRDAAVPDLFTEQARMRPDAVAVEFMGTALTYAELYARARRLAGALQARGVGPDTPVGLCMERSLEMVVATLAILMAGGAYVPLDPEYPADRLEYMLADAAAPLVVAQRGAVGRLPADATVLCPEDVTEEMALQGDVHADSLAYVMYTSGSTGRPKGVAIPHRGIVRLVRDTPMGLNADDVFLQLAPTAFDAATFEIWGALLNGGRLVLMPPGKPSSAEIGEAIRRHGVTTLWLTAGLFHLMVDERVDDLRPLRRLLAGGDVLSPQHVRKARRTLQRGSLVNGYGPTENTTFTACHVVGPEDDDQPSISIGRPIANTRAYVLDRHLQPLPVGIPGELCAAGDGLARGYWNKPELTAARFVRPGPDVPEERVYRTGDRARWRADGTLEFLGRMDRQLKIRGFRVEPAEIEFVLGQHAEVRACAVAALSDDSSAKRLVAWAVADAVSGAELRSWLTQRLPDHMVPSAITAVGALPLSPNGKVDVSALPIPEAEASGRHVAPRDALERELAAIWESILDVAPIGITDGFFELGGHSLLGVRLLAAVEKAFDKRLTLAALFAAQTVERLAEVLRANGRGRPQGALVDLQPRGSRPPMFWIHSLGGDAGGGFFYYRRLAKLLGPDQPSHGVRAPERPFTRVEAMATAYADEVMAAVPHGPVSVGGFCFGGNVAFEMARELRARGREVRLVVLLESAPPRTRSQSLRTAWEWVRTIRRSNWREKLTQAARKGRRLLRRGGPGSLSLEDYVDVSRYPREYLEAAQIHLEALHCYEPQPYDGAVALFRQATEAGEMSAYGWERLVRGDLVVHEVAGTHDTILQEPGVTEVAKTLRTLLEQGVASRPATG